MEDSSFQSPISQFNYASPEIPKKPKKFIYVIIFLVILVGFFLTKNLFFGSGKQKETPNTAPTPTSAEYQFPTDTPEPSVSPTVGEEEPTVAPTAKPVNPVDQSTGLDRSTLSVEVQNGSGVTGAAKQAADVLKGFGYKISATGNANNTDYINTTIQVKSTKSNFLALLKKDLGFSYTVGSASADLESSSTADALVIIGK
ncbi:MAG: lytR [Candidatus Levybacteria bacterium]|nr:lytR [Candidatus Levybacteria bacterium]